jgi:hypothetical protein
LHADRHEDTMSYVIKQQGLKGVDLPRSGLLEQPHQLGPAIPLRSNASRLCGALY